MSIERASRSPACLSELALDEWLADEGTAAERAAWQAHLASCAECQARREQRSAFNARYLASSRDLELARARHAGLAMSGSPSGAKPVGPVPRRVQNRAHRVRRTLGWLGSGALAAAASVVLFLAFSRDADLGSVRSKGSRLLDFYVKSGGVVRRGGPGEVVRPGDALRFVVPRAEQRYLVVLGRDSRGVASVYFPPGALAERAASGGEELGSGVALGASVVLDDAPGDERLYGVFCDRAVSTQALREELLSTGAFAPRGGCEVVETSIRKATP
jgi:anti-sigma factor RsiW